MKIVLKNYLSLLLCNLTLNIFAFGNSPVRLASPDNKILYEFDIRHGEPGYSVTYQGRKLIDFSTVHLVFKNNSTLSEFRITNTNRVDSVESYTLITGRSDIVNDHFRQLTIYLQEKKEPQRELIIEVRIFDDGVAFRYRFRNSKTTHSTSRKN